MIVAMAMDSSTPTTIAPAGPDLPAYIGKYRVLRRLGEGATSDVFLGLDEFQGQEVAIKRVRSWALTSRGAEGQISSRFFAAEAALAGRLSHPNVVQILDAVPDPEAPYLVMEYVPGVTLKNFKFEALDGGSLQVTVSALFHPTTEQAGALCALIQEDVQITLIPPTKQAKGSKPQQEDLAA